MCRNFFFFPPQSCFLFTFVRVSALFFHVSATFGHPATSSQVPLGGVELFRDESSM